MERRDDGTDRRGEKDQEAEQGDGGGGDDDENCSKEGLQEGASVVVVMPSLSVPPPVRPLSSARRVGSSSFVGPPSPFSGEVTHRYAGGQDCREERRENAESLVGLRLQLREVQGGRGGGRTMERHANSKRMFLQWCEEGDECRKGLERRRNDTECTCKGYK